MTTPRDDAARAANEAATGEKLRTARISIVAAILLVLVKLGAGLHSHSLGLVAEALHSATDLVAALLTFLAMRLAAQPPDRRHQFGHGKAEHLAALAEATFLVAASLVIAWQGANRLAHTGTAPKVEVGWLVLSVMVLVIGIDVWRTTSSLRAARKLHSAALAANAMHFGSDMLGSAAVLVGLILVRAGVDGADSVAALVVAVIVIVAAGTLMLENIHVLMDRAPSEAEAVARRTIRQLPRPVSLERLRIRRAAGRYFLDVVITVPATDHVGQAHAIADEVEAAVEAALPGADVLVHVEPDARAATMRDAAIAAALAVPDVFEVHDVTLLIVDDVPELSLHLKLRAELPLAVAHEVASKVERSISAAVGGYVHVITHIEPLSAPDATATAVDAGHWAGDVERVVATITGGPARDVRFRDTPKGLVAYLTVDAPSDAPLVQAHALATQVEDGIRELHPEIAEVVVHTEPAG